MSTSKPSAQSQVLMRRGTELLTAYYGGADGPVDRDVLGLIEEENASPREVIFDLTAVIVASQLMIQSYADESGYQPLNVLQRLAAVLQLDL